MAVGVAGYPVPKVFNAQKADLEALGAKFPFREMVLKLLEMNLQLRRKTLKVLEMHLPFLEMNLQLRRKTLKILEKHLPFRQETLRVPEKRLPFRQGVPKVLEKHLPWLREALKPLEMNLQLRRKMLQILEKHLPFHQETRTVQQGFQNDEDSVCTTCSQFDIRSSLFDIRYSNLCWRSHFMSSTKAGL
jgi:septum formation topological specificity factor MinE